MFVGLKDLFDMCKNTTKVKKIMLKVLDSNGKIKVIPMCNGHYIISNTWYTEIDEKSKYPLDSNKFIDEMETECTLYPDDWGSLYVSPMEELGNCELKFTNNLFDVEEGEENYEITKIYEDENNIYICLREI